MRRRDHVVDLHRGEQRARQGRILDDRHARRLGDLADAQGDGVQALGHAHRRRCLGGVVFQRHGIVRRVHHHHGGGRHGLDHAAARALDPHLLLAGLDVRVALGLFELLLDLLLGHFHPLQEAPTLPEVVGCGDDEQEAADREHQPAQDVGGEDQGGQRRHLRQVLQLRHMRVQHPPGEHAGEQELDQRLDELRRAVEPEHPLEPPRRRELGQVEGQTLGAEDEAGLHQVAGHPGRAGRQQHAGHRRKRRHHRRMRHRHPAGAGQAHGLRRRQEGSQRARHIARQPAAGQPDHRGHGGQRGHGRQVRRLDDLAPLARLGELARGGFFRTGGGVVGLAHGVS